MAHVHNVTDQPFTWIVTDDDGTVQFGTVDEFHNMDSVVYIATWFEDGKVCTKTRASFTTAVLTLVNAH